MIDSTTRSLGAAVAPLPGPAPTPPVRPPQSATAPPAHPFAELLRQNRLAAAGPAVATPRPQVAQVEDHAAPAPASDAGAAAAPEAEPPQREATPPKSRPAAASRDATRPPAADAPARSGKASEDEGGARRADAGVATTPAPDATALAGVVAAARPDVGVADEALTGQRSAGAQTQAAAMVDASQRLDAANDSAAAGASSPAGSLQADASAASATQQRDARGAIDAVAQRRGADAASALHEPGIASFADALAEAKATPEPRTALLGDPAGVAAAALAAPGAALTSVASGADATTLTASLATPVDAPDFAATFGAQVSVFVRDGVQHAELHLHPADMGPVSISITLDGTQARVDFGADVAATRQAIESGLPELASALSDAGFTLAGGGVAQHSRSSNGDGGDADANRSPQARHAPVRSAIVDVVATRRIAAGGVDVYA
jgi:flagellar hook-length control protein FliK